MRKGKLKMSQYTQIFVRKGNDFVEIGSYGRSSSIAKFFNGYAPWEKVKELTSSDVGEIIDNIKSSIQGSKDIIAKRQEIIGQVKTWNNSIEEKRELISEYMEYNAEDEEIIEEMSYALHVAQFLSSAIYEHNISWKYGDHAEGDKKVGLIYIGIEVGYEVTRDMIIEDN